MLQKMEKSHINLTNGRADGAIGQIMTIKTIYRNNETKIAI